MKMTRLHPESPKASIAMLLLAKIDLELDLLPPSSARFSFMVDRALFCDFACSQVLVSPFFLSHIFILIYDQSPLGFLSFEEIYCIQWEIFDWRINIQTFQNCSIFPSFLFSRELANLL